MVREANIARDDLNEDADEAEKARRDPEESLDNAPSDGSTIRDFFSFEEIFARVLSVADHELDATNRYLFWSGLGAGGALGLTFLARVIFAETAHEATPGVVGNLLYPVGFLIIVLGRYQLFTENTLTPVVLVLTKLASVANLARLWLVVLVANMVGAVGVAALLAYFDVLDAPRLEKAIEIGRHAHETGWFKIFSKAIIAGWIVAAMVWLVHACKDTVSRILVVWLLMYFIGVGAFFHVITSSVEVFFLAFRESDVDLLPLFPEFVLPVLLGNTIGGVTFVAVLNYALFAEHKDSRLFERYGERLNWRDWLIGIEKKHRH
ncbi:formate/nitrite transporter family protein [Jiella endophytica]|uniref:Formate/nitrite transporter family protein n=1 Tax=Jiella endophytica TaxID=2558362 RepID=A0A4Y8RS18_9HYPH|nr:formate/nitrite transporter family protein [Jiella endophytica]TFF20735.1 formate/nitrite transporter family protein [Jiella endophytica]TFF27036.1 formate/nitrite transporter family protein [Jiella endophytica]